MNDEIGASSTAPVSLLRVLAGALVFAVPVSLELARPLPLRVLVTDDRGRPIEAVVVSVAHAGSTHGAIELYTNEAGAAVAAVGGVRKTVDVAVNPAAATYDAETLHHLTKARYADAPIAVTLRPRLPTRQICRLTGYGSMSGPYQYAGQDSAYTLPYVANEGGRAVERLLWWFGDTVSESDGPILVSNKMATSDPSADASQCIALEYVGARNAAPLSLDASVAHEATVWLDVALVSSAEPRPHGGYAFRPAAGERLSLGYLSVADTKPLFTVTQLGLATAEPCADVDCGREGEGAGIHFVRDESARWTAPVEYARAPEQTAFLFGDTYTTLKVAERRAYCAAPPYAVDCSAKSPCADGAACIEPGKFCDEAPYVTCGADSDCVAGRCVRGGVIAMQVAREQVTDKSAYRYWDARSRSFEPYSGREPDAILVDARLGNAVSIMWSEFAQRWLMISNYEDGHYAEQRSVTMRSAAELLGPWGEPETIMENLGGQRSYNPRFVPAYTHAPRTNLVYWTATYDAHDESRPMHGQPFDYNVFLYETDLARVGQRALSKRGTSAGSTSGERESASQENTDARSAGRAAVGRSSSPSENAR